MKDSKKAVGEASQIMELAVAAHKHALDFNGLLDPTTREHARQQAITLLKAIEEHVHTALATLE